MAWFRFYTGRPITSKSTTSVAMPMCSEAQPTTTATGMNVMTVAIPRAQQSAFAAKAPRHNWATQIATVNSQYTSLAPGTLATLVWGPVGFHTNIRLEYLVDTGPNFITIVVMDVGFRVRAFTLYTADRPEIPTPSTPSLHSCPVSFHPARKLTGGDAWSRRQRIRSTRDTRFTFGCAELVDTRPKFISIVVMDAGLHGRTLTPYLHNSSRKPRLSADLRRRPESFHANRKPWGNGHGTGTSHVRR